MTQTHFNTLIYCLKGGFVSQKDLSLYLNTSLDNAISCLKQCRESGWIDNNNELTDAGYNALLPYKVDNAIIMAAGMSSRFAPLSYEKPKGLLNVKGEVLIERQIAQLISAGIDDITVVVGYKAEMFYYLKDQYNVKIVTNPDYYRYNNPSTLMAVLPQLKNTYICSSDNYFVNNVFEPFVFDSYYSAVYYAGAVDEWGVNTDKHDRIISFNHSPKDMFCLLGHAYFSREFSERFKKILSDSYSSDQTKQRLWEYILEAHLDELKIYIRKYNSKRILEFDCLEDLRAFDEACLKNADSRIIKNITKVLHCSENQISQITVIKQSPSFICFRFIINDNNSIFIYSQKDHISPSYSNYQINLFESTSMLGLDASIIYIDEQEGWMISKDNNHSFNSQ